jgi:hypothetical protein
MGVDKFLKISLWRITCCATGNSRNLKFSETFPVQITRSAPPIPCATGSIITRSACLDSLPPVDR